MKMLITPTSPYARKARAVVIEKGLNCEMSEVSPWDDSPEVLAANPLRKVPVLLLDNGTAMFDSRVICEYLDAQSEKSQFLPADMLARQSVKTREALVEGAMDAALMLVMTGRAAADMTPTDSWRHWLMGKAERALDLLEKDISGRNASSPDMSDVACYCFLDFWLFRMPQTKWSDWRDSRPQLAGWFTKMGERECFAKTDPRG